MNVLELALVDSGGHALREPGVLDDNTGLPDLVKQALTNYFVANGGELVFPLRIELTEFDASAPLGRS
ncbi:MAG: hypothetical protein QOE70_873 [Chthoniobacter sp.]|jgi:hypothetical protein|nr:hypothetical protein [Chthoniobacter sp.]